LGRIQPGRHYEFKVAKKRTGVPKMQSHLKRKFILKKTIVFNHTGGREIDAGMSPAAAPLPGKNYLLNGRGKERGAEARKSDEDNMVGQSILGMVT